MTNTSNVAQFLKENDGIDHINIYSRGTTSLGRWLSHFEHTPFTHPTYGRFESLEGFWYFISTGCKYDSFKKLTGYQAKTFGKNLPRVHRDDFWNLIREANRIKLLSYPIWLEQFTKSTLPFDHYYVCGPHQYQMRPKLYGLFCEMFEDLRKELRTRHG